MSDARAPKFAPVDIGKEALPIFAVLPDAAVVFAKRAERFEALAPGHPLAPYLTFLAGLSRAQHDIVADLPPAALPDEDDITQALDNEMPPLPAASLALDDTALVTLDRLLDKVAALSLTPATKSALDSLRNASPEIRRSIVAEALTTPPADALAQRVLVLAGLQVHFARLAAQLDVDRLKPISDGVCPSCGSLPVSSSVVGWPKAHNTRFCTCSLCSTMWHVVRVKCVLCSSTEGIGYRVVEGGPETVKAECCDSCKRYVKILYQVKDHLLEPVADDVANLGLDMLMAEEGWQSGAHNPFLVGS